VLKSQVAFEAVNDLLFKFVDLALRESLEKDFVCLTVDELPNLILLLVVVFEDASCQEG